MVWSVERATTWYATQGETSWKQGVNYIPSYAVNQIQMWQEYDAVRITQELQWASKLRYNALRVFLHDQLYTAHGTDFLDQVNDFLELAHGLGFQTILVLLEGKSNGSERLVSIHLFIYVYITIKSHQSFNCMWWL